MIDGGTSRRPFEGVKRGETFRFSFVDGEGATLFAVGVRGRGAVEFGEGVFGGALLGRFFAVSPSGLEDAVADFRRDFETAAVRRALFVEKDVSRDNAGVFAVQSGLKTRFKVAVEIGERGRRGVERGVGFGARSEKSVDFFAEIFLDEETRLLVTAVEKNRADRRLRRVRKDDVGDRLDSFADEKKTRQLEPLRNSGASFAADDRPLDAGKLAFVQFRERSVKQVGNGETERRVAEELEPLVRIDMNGRIGRMRQRFLEKRTVGEAVAEAAFAFGEVGRGGMAFHYSEGGARSRRLERGWAEGNDGERTRLKKRVGEGREQRERGCDEEREQNATR